VGPRTLPCKCMYFAYVFAHLGEGRGIEYSDTLL